MTSFIDKFHIQYHDSKIWEKNRYFGVPCWKLPFDMMILQELIVKTKPDFIIETGTGLGGSSMFYASICELLDHGKIITVDIQKRVDINKIKSYRWSDRIEFVYGGSTNKIVVDKIFNVVQDRSCIVILDSWHSEEHVYEEMNLYSKLVHVDNYMVVEDTHAGNPGNPISWEYDDKGPSASVERFIKENDNWVQDYSFERHLISFNPGGYLKKIK